MSLLPVHDALTAITNAMPLVQDELVPMADAATGDVIGRVLARDIYTQLDHPPHHVSAMDGYAVRHADLDGSVLNIIGESAAGHPFVGSLGAGDAVRIFTGAHCPKGSDTIIIQEDATQDGTTLTVHSVPAKGHYIRQKGNDFSRGDMIAKAGDALTPRVLALMAAAGMTELALRRRPVVAVLSTGDELAAPGQPPKEGEIISSNGVFLKYFLTQIGADVHDFGIIADNANDLNLAFRAAAFHADLIITSGGASVGKHDVIAKVMQTEATSALNFWRIAMRPGKPLIFGNIHATPILGLPGNPVSTGVCAMVFAATAIKALTGQDLSHNWGMPLRQGRLATALNANDQRQDYMRASLAYDTDGTPMLTPFSKQDSGMMKLFTTADALIIRAPFAAPAAVGDVVTFLPIPASV